MKIWKKIIIWFAAVVGIYYLVFGVFYIAGYRVYRIPTSSMEPTIHEKEMVIGRLSEGYRNHMQRFDIAIYKTSSSPGELFAKRIVGLSGEHIVLEKGSMRVDGNKFALAFPVNPTGLGAGNCDLTIPDESVFFLGDYSKNSMDSRYLGPIPKKDVVGYLVFKR